MTPAAIHQARCVDNPDALFVRGKAQNRAKHICQDCPLRLSCLREALEHRIQFGIWGGMTERERRALLHRHPTDWDQVIATTPAVTGTRSP